VEQEMPMHSETLRYEADGCAMRSDLYLDPDRSGPRPGILVFPEAFGLGDHARDRARRLAERGYVTLACDLHGDSRLIEDMGEVTALLGALGSAPQRIRDRAQGGLDALLARPEVDPARIAAIGYCFGGTMALELARGGHPVAATVGFHSGLATAAPDDAKNIQGKVLVCIGADDPMIGADRRNAFEEEMRAGGVDWQMNVYGKAVHSFTNPEADSRGQPHFARYDATADARSWREMLALFEELFGAA
jgi:dienelactone hydrolase